MLQLESQLSGLTDPGSIIEPDPIPFSFQAPGWYFLFALLLIISAILFFNWLKHYRKNTYRRHAIEKINNITDEDLNELLIILRLTAIQTFGRKNVAGLYGNEWFAFLDSKVRQPLLSPYEKMIMDFIYKEKAIKSSQFEEISANTKKWIKTHAA
jgi:hypothetical protein